MLILRYDKEIHNPPTKGKLHKEANTMIATKDEERKALARIKKIVEGLGENSYIATAFEGCFEKAEENIDYDMACSWKSVAESESKRADELKEKLGKANFAKASLEQTITLLQNRVAILEENIKAANNRLLSADTQSDIKCLVKDKISELTDELETAAKEIVEYADEPNSDKFSQAVRNHRNAQTGITYYEDILAEIEHKQHI